MSSKNLLNLPKDECLKVSEDIFRNCDQQWRAGKKLAKLEEFGPAISHLVISTEELVKALILAFDGRGFDFRNVRGMDIFFRNHGMRHALSYVMFAMGFFGEDLVKLIVQYKDKPASLAEMVIKLTKNDPELERASHYYTLRKAAQLKKEFDWFAQVDLLRQNGLYCDFKDDLHTPQAIDHQTYQEVYRRLKLVREIALGIKNTIVAKDPDTMAWVNDMRISMAANGRYKQIAEVLAVLRASKTDIFQLIKRRWEKAHGSTDG